MITALHEIWARQVGTSASQKEAWVYFIHGQSNAHGNSPNSNLSSPLNAVIPNCYIYYKPNASTDTDSQFDVDNGYWTPLQAGVNNQLTDFSSYYGPELKFGYEMQSYTKRDIFIIKFAIGDTALNSENTAGTPGAGGLLDWAPGSTAELYERSVQNYWLPAKAKLLAYGRNPIVKGGLWMQGERDSFYSSFASAYSSNLQALFAAWRNDYNTPSMHWAVGRISNEVRDARTYGTTVYSAQTSVGALTNNSLINTDSYTMQGDNVHYADHSQLGNDFYLKVKDL